MSHIWESNIADLFQNNPKEEWYASIELDERLRDMSDDECLDYDFLELGRASLSTNY